VPHPMIIPGSRFREIYYWDAFWILKGLLASRMTTSAIRLVENFIHLIDAHGFVPNGTRVWSLHQHNHR
jgi:alpha,alpha-trehalase